MAVTYNAAFQTNLTEEEFLQTTLGDLDLTDATKFFAIINEPDFFRDLEVLDADSIEVVRELNERFDVYIATAAMDVPGSFNAKYDWLREHFPFLNTQNYVFCGNKAVINTDYLIDDSPRQLTAFKGQGILYSMPYNAEVEGFVRVRGWREIGEYFDIVLKI